MRAKRLLIIAAVGLLAIGTGACSTEDRLKRVEVDGVDCVVATNGVGRPQALDCDFPAE
jgi:hypothetical protein